MRNRTIRLNRVVQHALCLASWALLVHAEPACAATVEESRPPRLAILSDAHTRTQADLLLLELQKDACELVERDQVERVVREQALPATLNRAAGQRIGRLLKADGLVLLAGGENKPVTVRLVAVAPGVVTWHAETDAGQGWAPTVARSLSPHFPKLTVAEKEAVPVSVLPIRPAFGMAKAIRLADDANRLLLLRLVRERALFVLERENLASVELESLWSGDAPSFWAGSYVLDGHLAFDLVNDHRLTLTLTLRPPQGGAAAVELVEHGTADDLAGLVERAAVRVRQAVGGPNHGPAWDLKAEADRLRGIVESLEDREQQKNTWATIMALGCRDAKTAAHYRDALRAASYRDAKRFGDLTLQLAPTPPGLEAQARTVLDMLRFHNTYQPPAGFGAEDRERWLFCYFPPLRDVQRLFDAVQQTGRAAELGELRGAIQEEANRTAERMLELDPQGQRGLAAVTGARYRYATAREILDIHRRWVFAAGLTPLEIAQRSTAPPWYLQPEGTEPFFITAATEPRDQRDRLRQAWLEQVRTSSRPELRIALARQRLREPVSAASGGADRGELQALLLANHNLFEFPEMDGLLAEAYGRAPAVPQPVDYERARRNAANAQSLFRALIRNGMLRPAHGGILLEPGLDALDETGARELYESLRRYVPASHYHEPVRIVEMMRWITDAFPAVITDDLRLELARQKPGASEPPETAALPVSRTLALPEFSDPRRLQLPPPKGAFWTGDRLWLFWADTFFCLDPVRGGWERVPAPPEHTDIALSHFERVHITDSFLTIWRQDNRDQELGTVLSLRPLAGGDWRTVRLPFEVRNLAHVGDTFYLASAVRQITVYQNTGLVALDARTLECRTIRAPGTPRTPVGRHDRPAPFNAVSFDSLRAVDGRLMGHVGNTPYAWKPGSEEAERLAPARAPARPADEISCMAHCLRFGFEPAVFNDRIKMLTDPQPALHVSRPGAQEEERVPIRLTLPAAEATPDPVTAHTNIIAYPTATAFLIPSSNQRRFWVLPYADIRAWLAAHPAPDSRGAPAPPPVRDLSRPAPGEVLRIALGRDASMDFCWIPAGRFMMGSPATEVGRSACEQLHEVELTHGFWIGRHEVTVKQCQAVLGRNPSYTYNPEPDGPKTLSWSDANAFMQKLSERLRADGARPELAALLPRLPTEAEWEYACRAGSSSALYTGAELSFAAAPCRQIDELAWTRFPRPFVLRPVGMKRPNAWGLFDMCGNAAEWCLDRYGDFSHERSVNPTGPAEGELRVTRGGSCFDYPAACRSASRQGAAANAVAGFRVVLSSVQGGPGRQ